MGDIHHFAWRAFHVNQTVYLRERDLEKCDDPTPGLWSRMLPYVCDTSCVWRLARGVVYELVHIEL